MNRTPVEIISDSFRESDVRPTLKRLSEDVVEVHAAIACVDKEIQLLQEQLAPIIMTGPAVPPPELVKVEEVPEPVRCGLSAEIQMIRDHARSAVSRLQDLGKWVETIRGDLRL